MRPPVLAAGGIVVRSGGAPLFAVVRMRKRGDWVLPKGKLEIGETPRTAAEREAIEETGHLVTVHEFLGTLAYEVAGRSKVVSFWRMEADATPSRPLMKDISAVDWLSLHDATKRLTRSYEQAFLAEVGPRVVAAAMRSAAPVTPPDRSAIEPRSEPIDDIADLAEAPSLALEQPLEGEGRPGLVQRLRAWWRGRV